MKAPILLVSNDVDFISELLEAFQTHCPNLEAFLPDQQGAENAILAACWYPENLILSHYPKLKAVHSLAAGVDHLGAEVFASGLPICRIVDENQRRGMFEFVLWGVLNAHRDFDRARTNQIENHWQRSPQKLAADIRIGVMGLGSFGEYVAKELAAFGYQVFGWSRSPKEIDGVICCSGCEPFSNRLHTLNQLDIVVNLLPLNPATQGILNKTLFDELQQGAYVINCGRGGHVNENDLMQAIEKGRLRGALLDVFNEEPLSASSPLWQAKGITITPHMASAASNQAIVKQVAENTECLMKGNGLANTIDTHKGY